MSQHEPRSPLSYRYTRFDRFALACGAVFFLGLGSGALLVLLPRLEFPESPGEVPFIALIAGGAVYLMCLAVISTRGFIDRGVEFLLDLDTAHLLLVKRAVILRRIPFGQIESFRHAPFALDSYAVLKLKGDPRSVRIHYSIEGAEDLMRRIACRVGEAGGARSDFPSWKLSIPRLLGVSLAWAAFILSFAILPYRAGAYGAVGFFALLGVGGAAFWIVVRIFGPHAVHFGNRRLTVVLIRGRTRIVELGEISDLQIFFLTQGRLKPSLLIVSREGTPLLLGPPEIDPLEMISRIVSCEPGLRQLCNPHDSTPRAVL